MKTNTKGLLCEGGTIEFVSEYQYDVSIVRGVTTMFSFYTRPCGCMLIKPNSNMHGEYTEVTNDMR